MLEVVVAVSACSSGDWARTGLRVLWWVAATAVYRNCPSPASCLALFSESAAQLFKLLSWPVCFQFYHIIQNCCNRTTNHFWLFVSTLATPRSFNKIYWCPGWIHWHQGKDLGQQCNIHDNHMWQKSTQTQRSEFQGHWGPPLLWHLAVTILFLTKFLFWYNCRVTCSCKK